MAKKASTRKRAPKSAEQVKADEPEAVGTDDFAEEPDQNPLTPEELAEQVDSGNGHYKSLDAAVLAAQRSVIGIFKDSRNKHHGFNYTRGESMIKFGREVFHKFGLVLRTYGNETATLPSGQDVLNSKYKLSHPESEQSDTIPFSLPIVTHSEKGNPIRTADKAALGSATESLAYVIRDILAVPRFEKDEDVNAETGIAAKEQFQTPKPVAATVVSGSVNASGGGGGQTLFMTDATIDALRKLIDATQSNEAKLLEYYKVKGISFMNELQYQHCTQVLTTKLEAGNIARSTGGQVASVKVTTPPPEAAPAPAADSQTLQPQQIKLIRSSLTAKKKEESDLLANFAFATLEEIPVSTLNGVMAWIRA